MLASHTKVGTHAYLPAMAHTNINSRSHPHKVSQPEHGDSKNRDRILLKEEESGYSLFFR